MRRQMARHAELLREECYGCLGECQWHRPLTIVDALKVAGAGALALLFVLAFLTLLFSFGRPA